MNNMNTKKLVNSIRENDFAKYQEVRYHDDEIFDGETLIFREENFANVDFAKFNLGFWWFEDCDLSGAKNFSGQPITFVNCNLSGADFCGVSTVIKAENSDFRDVKFDNKTQIYASEFVNCKLDPDFAKVINK